MQDEYDKLIWIACAGIKSLPHKEKKKGVYENEENLRSRN
jgi:hypothetical protein